VRLLNYLIEDVEKLFNQLERNCSSFIKEMQSGENLLLRVRTDYSQKPLIFVIKGRTGREPKDTPKVIQKKIDEYLKSKFGWKPRADGLFAWIQKRKTASMKRNMGRIIFPANGYKYVYNPKVVDLYNFMTFFVESELTDDFEVDVDQKFFEYFEKELIDGYTNKNAMKFKVGRNDIECMISAPFFYAVAPEMIPKLNEKFGLDISISSYKPGFW
jgi:hypothetical protein